MAGVAEVVPPAAWLDQMQTQVASAKARASFVGVGP